LITLAALFVFAAPTHAVTPRPNVVFILIDDLRFDELHCTGHPFAETPNIDRIASEGLTFTNAFAVTPLCSPSRASFLTGMYPHNHGILDNVDRSPLSHSLVTFPRLLHDVGYQTAFLGKWHMGVDDSPRPGFDLWLGLQGQGEYVDPVFNENGQRVPTRGYVTDLLSERAASFVRERHDRPFLLYLSHKAVHPNTAQRADGSLSDPSAAEFLPAERHATLYADAPALRRPNSFVPPTDKPALARQIGDLPPLGKTTGTDDETIRKRARMMKSVDEGVGKILAALDDTGHRDDTLVIFTSDHGYFFGEHGLSVERRLAYEEAIRIPLLMRYPPLLKTGTKNDAMVLSVDLAPTLLELGGAKVPADLDGKSLVSLLTGRAQKLRDSFLIEYFSDTVFPRMKNMGYRAVRTSNWKYIHYLELADSDELYDLAADPYESMNRINDLTAAPKLAELQAELSKSTNEMTRLGGTD
jgi:N-acetylglucosamine-6-sulfatase